MSELLIIGFLFHLIGDYLFQNDWMAQNKTKDSIVAFIHAIIYSMPFYLITDPEWWVWIFLTHLVIDRYRLAEHWIRLVNWKWDGDNFGYDDSKPKWMSVWLMIIIDNTFHILINSFCIYMS